MLEIKDLHVEVEGKEVLKGISLTIKPGELHAIMGPNGTGKSSLANVLAGHPKYKITKGTITFQGKDLSSLQPHERAKAGIFLAFQYPLEIPGVTLSHMLFQIAKAAKKDLSPLTFYKGLQEKAVLLGIEKSFLSREMNVGFSGGEKKRAEILQLMVLKPQLAILDETDSGLDIDSLKIIAQAIQKSREADSQTSALLITHYKRILNYLKPDFIHVLIEGKIVASGSYQLADELEAKGYAWLSEEPEEVAAV